MKGFIYEAYELLESNNTNLKYVIVTLAMMCGYGNDWLYDEPGSIALHHIDMKNKGYENNIKNVGIIPFIKHEDLHKDISDKAINGNKTKQEVCVDVFQEYVENGDAIPFYDLLKIFMNKIEKQTNIDEKHT